MDAIRNVPPGVKAPLTALVSQVVALLVGYGVLPSAGEGKWVAITMAVVNSVGLIAHAWHRQIDVKPYR